MAQVKLSHVSKSFSADKKVLDEISFEIQDKSFCVLLGPSGCGKSTLLRIISGLEKEDSGEIYIDGRKVNDVEAKDRDIAFVFQSYALYPHLSVYDNIAFPLKIRKLPKAEIDKKVKNVSSMLNLEEYLKRKPKELSGGQRQRVALGRAIVRDAKVYLLDEPLSNLDAKLRSKMRLELKKLHQKLNATFIYVTHDQTEALTMGDEIVILNEGVICQKGTSNEILNNPKNTFVAGFSGVYPMNLVLGEISEGKVNIFDTNYSAPINYQGKIILGISPENICLEPFEGCIGQKLRVDFIEVLGAIKVVHFEYNGTIIKGIISMPLEINSNVTLYFDPEKIKYFDYNTKQAILS